MEKNVDQPLSTGDLLPPEGRPLILVVDDDELFLEACARLLSVMGFQVEQARDGQQGLELARQRDYRVILLDVKMPTLDGLSCLRQLKSEGCRADIVMVTGLNDVRSAVDMMKAGASDVVTKPFQATELVTRLSALLNQTSSAPPAPPFEPPPGAERRKNSDRRQGGDRRRGGDRRLRASDPLIAHIRENAAQINTRQDVAAALHLTPELVSERVHQATGQFFRQFLHACRVDMARILLETTDLSIAEIAARTGFATIQHFSRIFGSTTGLSPRKYRQQRSS